MRLPTRIALVVVAWTLIGLFSAGQWYLFQLSRGEPPGWTGPLLSNLASCWIWAGFTPFVVHLARRFRVQRATFPVPRMAPPVPSQRCSSLNARSLVGNATTICHPERSEGSIARVMAPSLRSG